MKNNIKCCSEVKEHFAKHIKCNKKRKCKKRSGFFLNKYVAGSSPFDPSKSFNICYTMNMLIESESITEVKEKDKPVVVAQVRVADIEQVSCEVMGKKKPTDPGPTATRSSRYQRRVHERDGKLTFEELKDYHTVAIKCGASDDEDFDEVIDITEEKVPKKRVTYLDKILDYSMKYKFPFRKLKWKNRVDRIDDISARIIACCLDREEVKKNGMKYITGNEDFAHEVLNIVNGIKDRLDVKLKVDMKAIDEPRPCELNDDDDIVVPMDEESFNMAYTILGESTGRGYERIRKKFNEINIDKPLPSMYFLNKKLPIKIEAIEFDSNSSELDMTADKDKLLYGLATGKDVKSEEEALMLFSQKDQLEKTIGAKLYGNLDNYVDLMRKQHEDKGVTIQDGEDVILLSSFDGAEAIRTNTKVSTVISYSSSMLTSSMITSKQVKAGSSFNICTWMQVLGKEEFTTLNGSLSNYFQSRQEYTSGTKKIQHLPNSKVYCYDVHDGKMMYMLFQHSVWNRKHHPFIMCK